MKRKICVVTGTRSDYGLLRGLMERITLSPVLCLQIIATGMHLSPEFGLTYQEIEQDNFRIDRKIETLLSSDTAIGVTKAMGLGLISFSEAFDSLNPDLVVLLGDRFEMFAAATACHIAGLPIAHLHGGELTEGAFDDALRHAITKMASLHFVATEQYRQRVIQLGEQPSQVFLVGAFGIDSITRLTLRTREQLERDLEITLQKKNLLVTFHPVTIGSVAAQTQMGELLAALHELKDTRLVFTYPNADTGGRSIIKLIDEFVKTHSNAAAFASLGQQKYFSCIKEFDGVIGNSSSGIIEVPTFQKGTINIGNRQLGRVQGTSVINCEAKRDEILDAIQTLYSVDFQGKLSHTTNPYGDGGACEKVISIIENLSQDDMHKKSFYDLSRNNGLGQHG